MFNKRPLVLFVLVALVFARAPQALAIDLLDHAYGTWHKIEHQPNCRFLNILFTEQRPSLWTGGCENGYVQGEGIIAFENDLGETRFSGTFVDGVMEGHGLLSTWLLKDGELKEVHYTGDFKTGIPEGMGILVIENSLVYSGQFRNMEPHGKGVLVIGRNFKLNREIEETGKLESLQGEDMVRMAGTFDSWGLNGTGIISLPDGSFCKGEWKDNNLEGIGVGRSQGKPAACLQDKSGNIVFGVVER